MLLDDIPNARIVSPKVELRLVQDASLNRNQKPLKVIPSERVKFIQAPKSTKYAASRRTPLVSDPGVQELIKNYPPSKAEDRKDHRNRIREAKRIVQSTSNCLIYDNSEHAINEANLKIVAERHRCDMNLMTTRLLQDLDQADIKQLKSLYNYNLNT